MTPLPSAYNVQTRSLPTWEILAGKLSAIAALVFNGAIFGFFYAWVCSTMWGLDAADPRVAIEAMQAMNASVRNAVFAPAFFGTPFVLWIAALFAWRTDRGLASLAFFSAGIVYAVGGMILTMLYNVPMNETLGQIAVPSDLDTAQSIWTAYSAEWQTYNVIRTVLSGVSLVLTGIGLLRS